MTTISLNAYEDAERMLARTEGRRGVIVHAIITAIVSVVLIVINVFAAPEFPWSAFAVGGMLIGLGFHYYFGLLHVEQNVIAHQERVELRAQRIG
jgi:hypothetical protein